MTTLLLSTLLLVTIIASFSLGIALGYWAICGVLNFFDPGRTGKSTGTPALAHTASGD